MRRFFRWMTVCALPIIALRVFDVILNVNLTTGFYDSGEWIPRVAQVVVVAVVVFLVYLRARQTVFLQGGASAGLFGSIFFALSGIIIALASALQIIGAFAVADLKHIFMGKRQILLAGFTTTHFRIEFWCGVVGLLTAVWFMLEAARFFLHDIKLPVLSYFALLPVIWYCLRTLCDYSLSPVNPHNALILTYLAVSLILGVFYLRYGQYMAFGQRQAAAVRLIPSAMLAFLITLSFKAPLVAILPHDSTGMLLALADCFSAVTAFVATDLVLKGSNHYVPK